MQHRNLDPKRVLDYFRSADLELAELVHQASGAIIRSRAIVAKTSVSVPAVKRTRKSRKGTESGTQSEVVASTVAQGE